MTAQITRIRSRAARIDIRARLLQRVALFEAALDGGYGIAQPNIEARVPEARLPRGPSFLGAVSVWSESFLTNRPQTS
jgi:hypothetical protein